VGVHTRFHDWDEAKRAQTDLGAKLQTVWTNLMDEYTAFQKDTAENLSALEQVLEQQTEGERILKNDLEKLGE